MQYHISMTSPHGELHQVAALRRGFLSPLGRLLFDLDVAPGISTWADLRWKAIRPSVRYPVVNSWGNGNNKSWVWIIWIPGVLWTMSLSYDRTASWFFILNWWLDHDGALFLRMWWTCTATRETFSWSQVHGLAVPEFFQFWDDPKMRKMPKDVQRCPKNSCICSTRCLIAHEGKTVGCCKCLLVGT